MENTTNTFDNLLEKTTKHLETKKYVFRPRMPKMTGSGRNKEVVRDNDGNIQYKKNAFYDPTASKNVMLSIALSMALENYSNVRPHTYVKILKTTDISEMLIRYFSKKFYDKLDNSLIDDKQNQEYQAIENFRKIEYKIFGTLGRLRNYHSHYVHEPSILSFEDYFNNNAKLKEADLELAKFWFEKHFNDAKNHLQNSLNTRKEKLTKEKENPKITEKEKTHLNAKLKEIDKAINKFKYELVFFNEQDKISLNGQLFMATMFLYKRQAKIVLDKWRSFRLDKDLTGYGNSIHTFFTYYCMSEKYSLNNYNDSLLKFRNITSKLSTIPSSTHEKLSVIYDKIREINDNSYKEVERLEKQKDRKPKSDGTVSNELKALILQKNTLIDLLKSKNKSSWRKQLEALEVKINTYSLNNISKLDKAKLKIMPIRNRNILTEVLLQYMLDFKLFGTNTEIAIAKTITDRLDYFENHTEISEKESLTHLKNRKKENAGLSTEERTILNEHYKELKRNFIFKTVSELEALQNGFEKNEKGQTILKEPQGFQFAIKKKNALIRYTLKEGKTNKVVNVTLSPQLLLKLVFIHIEQKDNKVFEKYIEKFIKTRIRYFNIPKITAQQLVEKFKKENNNLDINKIIPKSILNQVDGYRKNALDNNELIKERFKTRIEYLEKFRLNNLNQPKPWQYASKQKIDIILNYMHYKLMYAVFANDGEFKEEKDVMSFIRHTYFNTDSYDVARQYFRFFGRYTKGSIKDAKGYGKENFVMPNQITKLVKEDNPIIFNFIKNEIDYATSLEELYSAVISNYIDALEKLHNDYLNNVKHNYAKILKIKFPTKPAHINSLINTHFLKSFAIGDEIIQVKTILPEQWKQFKTQKEKVLNGKPSYFSEYAFIREHLQSKDKVTTNIDYIFKHILPQIFNENQKIPYQIFRELLKLKTEELVLWNIAKVYWFKANGAAYDLKSLAQNSESNSYQIYTSFNKVYKQELDYTIKIDTVFWNATKPSNRNRFKAILAKNPELPNKEIYIKLKVPAKRYDNKFLKVETQLIAEFALYNFFETNFDGQEIKLPEEHVYIMQNNKPRTYYLHKFDDLIKVIYRDLKNSLNNIGDLLRAEKRIIDTTDFNTNNELTKKYVEDKKYKEKKENITDFFISFNNTDLLNRFNAKNLTNDDLQQFRNNALHYQLQNPNKIEEIEDLLKSINTKGGISNKEFDFEE